jgi:flagellar hook-associated protein 2
VKDLVSATVKPPVSPPPWRPLTDWLSSKGIIQAAKDGVSKTLNKLTDQYNAERSLMPPWHSIKPSLPSWTY